MEIKALKRKTHLGKWILRGIAVVCSFIVVFVVVLAGIQHIATPLERRQYPAPGKMVTVNGKNMHVYTQGQGEKTFVLLSGGGIGAPVLEYKPLWSRLSQYGRVAVVEYFGYGWSDTTNVSRTSENVVEEIRAALKGADLQPPYILVPHSMSGIYAMAYAQKYREEIEAIIALDTTLPNGLIQARNQGASMPKLGILPLLRESGILRLALWLNPLLVSGAQNSVYTKEEQRMIATVTSWNYANNTLGNEYKMIENNMLALLDANFPEDLPVLMIQAAPPGKQSQANTWSFDERKRLTKDLKYGKVVCLPAGHSGIYWYLSDSIVQETLKFLEDAK